jgi:hypothetical protein
MLRAVDAGEMKSGDAGALKEGAESMAITGDSFGATDRPATDKSAMERPSLEKPSGVLVGVSPVNVPEVPRDAAEHFGLLHVLVVDDDDAVRKACCQIARGMGFAVVLGGGQRDGGAGDFEASAH